MRRIVCSLLAAAALAGCASTGYYHQDGAADYYYERDRSYTGYYAGYSAGPGYYGFYDPYWGSGFQFGLTSWPYSAYGYGSYYSGWPYFGYSPWYDSWWGVGYNDWSWHRHQQTLARQRVRNVEGETAAVAAMSGRRMPSRDAAMGANRSARLAPDVAGEPGRSRGFDAGRQLRTESVDPYYGTPRVRRGEGPERRESMPLGAREMPLRDRAARTSSGVPMRDERPIRTGPAFDERRFGTPDQRAPAPVRSAPSAPMRTFTPAPAMERAPSFTPRAESSAPSGGGRTRTHDN
jgi:hypothetical protein